MGASGLDGDVGQEGGRSLHEHAYDAARRFAVARSGMQRAQRFVRNASDWTIDDELALCRAPQSQRAIALADLLFRPVGGQRRSRRVGSGEQHQARGVAPQPMQWCGTGKSRCTRVRSVFSRKPAPGSVGSPAGLSTASSAASR